MYKYERVRVLGRGGFGAAILVRQRSDRREYVIKEVEMSALSRKEQDEALKEASLLRELRHPNIISYVESFVDKAARKLCIVMDYADGGDLHQLISRRKRERRPLDEDEALFYFVQICLALRHIHDRRILHRDLKSQNVFLTGRGVVKLGDFGIAARLTHTKGFRHTQIGTPYYLSPEICKERPYDHRSDMWSLGCLLYELCALRVPFEAPNIGALVHRIVHRPPAPLPSRYSADLRALSLQLLNKDPRHRPGIHAVLSSAPVLRGMAALKMRLTTRHVGEALAENKESDSKEPEAAKDKGVVAPSRAAVPVVDRLIQQRVFARPRADPTVRARAAVAEEQERRKRLEARARMELERRREERERRRQAGEAARREREAAERARAREEQRQRLREWQQREKQREEERERAREAGKRRRKEAEERAKIERERRRQQEQGWKDVTVPDPGAIPQEFAGGRGETPEKQSDDFRGRGRDETPEKQRDDFRGRGETPEKHRDDFRGGGRDETPEKHRDDFRGGGRDEVPEKQRDEVGDWRAKVAEMAADAKVDMGGSPPHPHGVRVRSNSPPRPLSVAEVQAAERIEIRRRQRELAYLRAEEERRAAEYAAARVAASKEARAEADEEAHRAFRVAYEENVRARNAVVQRVKRRMANGSEDDDQLYGRGGGGGQLYGGGAPHEKHLYGGGGGRDETPEKQLYGAAPHERQYYGAPREEMEVEAGAQRVQAVLAARDARRAERLREKEEMMRQAILEQARERQALRIKRSEHEKELHTPIVVPLTDSPEHSSGESPSKPSSGESPSKPSSGESPSKPSSGESPSKPPRPSSKSAEDERRIQLLERAAADRRRDLAILRERRRRTAVAFAVGGEDSEEKGAFIVAQDLEKAHDLEKAQDRQREKDEEEQDDDEEEISPDGKRAAAKEGIVWAGTGVDEKPSSLQEAARRRFGKRKASLRKPPNDKKKPKQPRVRRSKSAGTQEEEDDVLPKQPTGQMTRVRRAVSEAQRAAQGLALKKSPARPRRIHGGAVRPSKMTPTAVDKPWKAALERVSAAVARAGGEERGGGDGYGFSGGEERRTGDDGYGFSFQDSPFREGADLGVSARVARALDEAKPDANELLATAKMAIAALTIEIDADETSKKPSKKPSTDTPAVLHGEDEDDDGTTYERNTDEAEEEEEEEWVEHEVDAAEMMDDLEVAMVEAETDAPRDVWGEDEDEEEEEEEEDGLKGDRGGLREEEGDVLREEDNEEDESQMESPLQTSTTGHYSLDFEEDEDPEKEGVRDRPSDDHEQTLSHWSREFRTLPFDDTGPSVPDSQHPDEGKEAEESLEPFPHPSSPKQQQEEDPEKQSLRAEVLHLRASLERCLGEDDFEAAYEAVRLASQRGASHAQQAAALAAALDVEPDSQLAVSFQPLIAALLHLESTLDNSE